VTDKDENLLGQLARRNWVILGCLLLLSLFWRSKDVTLGVLSGGLVAIAGYHWLHHSLKKLLAQPTDYSSKGFRFTYFVRLGALTTILLVLVTLVGIDPFGMAAGLSVVVINIFVTTLKRSL